MENYKNETLDILRYIANYMRGFSYKKNSYNENLLLLETGLVSYSVDKLRTYNVNIEELKFGKVNLNSALTLLENFIPIEDQDKFFYQYLNSTNMIISALQDKEINLTVDNSNMIAVIKGNANDNKITDIVVGKEISPKERIIELLQTLKEDKKEISIQR